MLIDKTHKVWALASALLLLPASGAFVVYALRAPDGPTGGSVPGLLYGIAGSALMLFAALLAVRRRFPRWRLGNAQFWLRGHIWLGLVSVPLIFFHTGGGFGGPVETVLMALLLLVTVSGLYGLAMQHLLPHLITQEVPRETFPQQIGYLCRRLQVEGDLLVSQQCGPIAADDAPLQQAAYNVAETRGDLRNGKEEEDFRKFLQKIYARRSAEPPSTEPAAANDAAPDEPKPAAGPSPTAAAPASPVADEVNGTPRAKSPLELARAAAAAKRAAADPNAPSEAVVSPTVSPKPAVVQEVKDSSTETPPPQKVLSPLERMRAAAAAKRASAAGPNAADEAGAPATIAPNPAVVQEAKEPPDDSPPAPKALSPLERMRAAAAAKRAAADSTAASETGVPATASPTPVVGQESKEPPEDSPPVPKSLSPLERMRAAAAAKRASAAGPNAADEAGAPATVAPKPAVVPEAKEPPDDCPPPQKSLSPLERMRAAAAAKSAGAAVKTPPAAKPAGAIDADGPAAAKPVPSVARKTPPLAARGGPAPKPKRPAAPVPRVEILHQFYTKTVRPFLDPSARRSLPLAKPMKSRQIFRRVRADLPTQLHDTLERLESFCEERRQFQTQARIHFWLHSWLYLHIPATVALLVLFVAHVLTALRVVPWAL